LGLLLVVLVFGMDACKEDSVLDTYPFPGEPVFFEHVPVALDSIISFVPMGEPNVYPKDHGGFPLKNPFTFPPEVPVFAVASGVIILAGRGTRSVPDGAPNAGNSYDDFHFRLQISRHVIVNYAHVTALNFDVMKGLENLPADESSRNVEIVVEAGDILGWLGPHGATDFSVTDRTLKLDLLNPSRYPDDHIYSADIYHYFKSPLLEQMVKIAARDAPPWGGKVDYDIAGRIRGNWFLQGTTSQIQWSHELSIVYDHLHSNRIFISDGSPMKDVPGIEGPGRPDIWWVNGNSPRPEDVGQADGITQYQLIFPGPGRDEIKPVQGVMLVEMIDEASIRVEVFKGVTTASAFTAAAKIYER